MTSPTTYDSDAFSVGQLARAWEKSTSFVKRLISEGKLSTDERGLIPVSALKAFYREHGADLDT